MLNEIKSILESNSKDIEKMLSIKNLNVEGNTNEAMLIKHICKTVYNSYDFIAIMLDIVVYGYISIGRSHILIGY